MVKQLSDVPKSQMTCEGMVLLLKGMSVQKLWKDYFSHWSVSRRCVAESVIERRASHVDLIAPAPHELDGIHSRHYKPGFFPALNEKILKREPTGSKWVPTSGLVSLSLLFAIKFSLTPESPSFHVCSVTCLHWLDRIVLEICQSLSRRQTESRLPPASYSRSVIWRSSNSRVELFCQCVLLFRSKRQDAKWRKKDRGLHHSEHLGLNSDQREVSVAQIAPEWSVLRC